MKTQERISSDLKIAVRYLLDLIAIPSFSGEESGRASRLQTWLTEAGFKVNRSGNNVWAFAEANDGKPILLLNSHLDTVKPNGGYTRDPFIPEIKNGKLFGLGTTDAGASVIALMLTFMKHRHTVLPWKLCFLASAEEENSGPGGISSIVGELGNVACAIVGEPTEMQPCVAQKGLMVLDMFTRGASGHAAREVGDNAIYKAMKDIEWVRTHSFPKTSSYLGTVKMTVTVIEGGIQHNVIPDLCRWTVDVRTTDVCTNEEVLEILRENLGAEVIPRSMRLKPVSIPAEHPLVKAAIKAGGIPFGSRTLSDSALLPFPALKIGPGKSERSHTADEFILLSEFEEGIEKFDMLINLLQ